MTDKKLVVVNHSGPILELGSITGPIISPSRVSTDIVARMVSNNKIVYEVNPNNRSERIKLTIANVRKDNFGPQASKEQDKPEPVDKISRQRQEVPEVTKPVEEVKPVEIEAVKVDEPEPVVEEIVNDVSTINEVEESNDNSAAEEVDESAVDDTEESVETTDENQQSNPYKKRNKKNRK